MKQMVLTTMQKLPDKIADHISKHCWFISSFEDGWAFVLRGEDIKKGEYIIFLSDELLREDENQVTYTILHEIGHVVLGHRNSIGKVQSKREVNKQEKAAHDFVIKYFSV